MQIAASFLTRSSYLICLQHCVPGHYARVSSQSGLQWQQSKISHDVILVWQAACVPLALTGRDICGSAVTGMIVFMGLS